MDNGTATPNVVPIKQVPKTPTPREAWDFIVGLLESQNIQWQGLGQARHVDRCIGTISAALDQTEAKE